MNLYGLILKETLSFSETQKISLSGLTFEILDSQIVQMKSRFEDFPRLQFVELLNENKLTEHKKEFPNL